MGYRGEIGKRHVRQRPPSINQPRTGMLSFHFKFVLHQGQRDGRVTTVSPRGIRQITTFRKLPTVAPKKKNQVYRKPAIRIV